MEHPLLGVGTTLRNGYLREKLDEDPGAEIQKWNKNIDELGLLRGGFALLGDYSLRFAETGFLGLGLYLFPSLILMWTFGKVLIKRRGEASSVFAALAFIGIMATGLGDGINITFCYWMAMALSFLMLSDGDEEYTPLLWFLDPDTERGKYVCQQKISSMQGKFYKIFAWIRKWKNYGVLLKKIVSPCVISLCISEATLYGFEFINSRLGWALDLKSTDFLTIVAAGISVAGVLLALYGSNIVAVFSSRYSRAPSEVFNLFMSNFIINAGVKAVLYYIVYSFCFIYRLWKVPETSYLLTGIWYFFTLAMILIFAQLGLKSLTLTDAFKLLRSEYNEAFSSLELLWNRNPLVRGKNVTLVRETLMQNLKTMGIVERNALSSGDFSCPSLLTFMCNNISLLWRYMEIKHTFPFDSPWFPQKLVNPKWYEMPGYQKRIAVQLGGGVQPKQERDSFFIEELIESINLRGISKLSQDANMNYRRAYFQYLGRSLITGFNLGEYKFIANSIATIQKEWVHDWSKSEKKESAIIMVEDISYLYVSTLLGVLQKVQTIDVDKIIDYVASCTKFNDIDFQKSPFSNTQECRQFMECIAAEQIIEENVLTPRWFIKQFHAKDIFLKMDKIERDTALTGLFQMGQLSDFAYAKKNYIAFIYLLIRMQEYHVKWAFLTEKIEACKSSCQKYYVDKETYPWNENDDNLNELWLQTLAIMDERRLTALNQLLLDYDEHALWLQKNMDILGSQFAMLNEWMIDRITQNDKNTFEQSYHIYKKTAILYSQVIGRTIERTGSNVIWQLDQINHPLVDLIVISGYALLWGEVTGDDSWKEILVNSSELKQDKDLLKAFILWRSYSTVEIDELRFDWKRKMEVAVENLPVFEKTCNQNGLSKITDEKRNLIFNRCIGGMHGNCDINSNAVCDLYPVMLLNKAVPLEKRYKSRYWTAEEV